jgi:hypothetical protein
MTVRSRLEIAESLLGWIVAPIAGYIAFVIVMAATEPFYLQYSASDVLWILLDTAAAILPVAFAAEMFLGLSVYRWLARTGRENPNYCIAFGGLIWIATVFTLTVLGPMVVTAWKRHAFVPEEALFTMMLGGSLVTPFLPYGCVAGAVFWWMVVRGRVDPVEDEKGSWKRW